MKTSFRAKAPCPSWLVPGMQAVLLRRAAALQKALAAPAASDQTLAATEDGSPADDVFKQPHEEGRCPAQACLQAAPRSALEPAMKCPACCTPPPPFRRAASSAAFEARQTD